MQMISVPLHSTTNNYHLDNNREVVDAKGVVQQFTIYEFDFAPYQADKQKAVKGVTTVQIHDKQDLVATPIPIEGADAYFVKSNVTRSAVPHFINNTLFWNQVRNLSEGSYRVENGNIIRQ